MMLATSTTTLTHSMAHPLINQFYILLPFLKTYTSNDVTPYEMITEGYVNCKLE